ncbi:MAG: DUF4956 domain-containing protein [Ignavibacteriae bacterium]|nr:DUF4956 domain-containing protein [Ignavibacteriota bacterium]MCB9208022.1 DUF4956 domain-containing protein [Ignavibacteriales bacterium]MCB9258791.1 DUF4956 domain-containing protein [Ignavibacteriales bacterium]
MFEDLNNIFNVQITPQETIYNLFVALIAGIIISIFYRKSYNGPGYQASYVNSLIMLVIITSIVIMVIGNNLARAFGLVGAMSIIRFRTAVKETQDIMFIFFALAIGMAVGVGLHLLAIFSSIFIGIIALFLSKSKFSTPIKSDLLLQFTFDANGNESATYSKLIDQYCRKSKLINAKAIGNAETLELSYYVGFKNKEKTTEFVQQLRKVDGVANVNLFYDEEYF